MRIVDSRIKAEKGVNSLLKLLSEAEVLSEVIRNDFGEDILLTTNLEGIADPFSIWMQVKYRSVNFKKDNTFRVRFNSDHFWRWISKIEPTILCIYDPDGRELYAKDAKETITLWNLAMRRYKTLSVSFSEQDKLSVERLKSVIWKARIRYYSVLLALEESKVRYSPSWHKPDPESSLISMYFLKSVRIIGDSEIYDDFRIRVRNAAINLSRNYPETSLEDAVTLALLAHVEDRTGSGMPGILITHGIEMAAHFFRMKHPGEWKFLSALFHQKWNPYGIRRIPKDK